MCQCYLTATLLTLLGQGPWAFWPVRMILQVWAAVQWDPESSLIVALIIVTMKSETVPAIVEYCTKKGCF